MTNEPEIRIIDGKKYQVVKTICKCICHSFPVGHVKHIMPCCQGGFRQRLVLIEESI